MKLWLRAGVKTHLPDGCSMSIVFNGIYRALRNLGYDVVLTNPGEKCCELWWPGSWETESDNFIVGYTGGDAPFSEPALQGWEKLVLLFVVNAYYLPTCHAQAEGKLPIYAWRHSVAPERFPAVASAITGLDESPFTFIHSCFQSPRKGGQFVCEAFTDQFSDEDIRLEVIGVADEPFFKELQERWQHPKIHFITVHRPNVQMYRNYHGHCFVYPSLYESWGLCVTEAMCSGMPCILSRLPTFAAQFNELCGWWVEMDAGEGWGLPNLADLGTKMRYAFEHRKECQAKGMYAAQMVRHSLSFEHGILLDFLPVLSKYGIEIDRVIEPVSYAEG